MKWPGVDGVEPEPVDEAHHGVDRSSVGVKRYVSGPSLRLDAAARARAVDHMRSLVADVEATLQSA